MAEKVGFEPTVPFDITGFQDQLLKPLGHLSVAKAIIHFLIPHVKQIFILPADLQILKSKSQ